MSKKIYLYHGSDVVVSKPWLIYGNVSHDFGKAFYLTSDYTQAYNWAKHKVRRQNYKNFPKVSVFEFDTSKLENLKVLSFTTADEKWLDYIAKNRNIKSFAVETKYDLVIGPVVDGFRSWYNITRYYNHELSFEEALDKLHVERLVDQWAFKTNAAISTLIFKGVRTHE